MTIDDDRTEPAADFPKRKPKWSFVVGAILLAIILVKGIFFPNRSRPVPNPVSVIQIVPTSIPTEEERPAPAAVLRVAEKKTPKPEKKSEVAQYLDDYRKFTPSSLKRLKALLEKAKKGKDETDFILADAYSYLGYRDGSGKSVEKGLRLAEKWKKGHRDHLFADRTLALAHWAARNFAKALPSAQKALARNPGEPISRFLVSSSRIQQGKEDGEIEKLADAYAKFPETFPLGEDLAGIYLSRGRYKEAEPIAEKLLELEPNDTKTIRMLGESLEGQGKWDEIVTRFEPVAAKTGDADLKLLVSQAYRRTDRYPQANKLLSDLIKAQDAGTLKLSKSKMAFFYSERGKLEFDQQKYAKSIVHLRKSLELNPSDRSNLKFLAGALFRVKKYAEAADVYAQAVKSDPDDVQNRQSYGMALLEAGKLVEAEKAFQDVLKKDPKSASALYYLARVAEKSGDKPLAIRRCEESLAADPSYENAQKLLEKLKN